MIVERRVYPVKPGCAQDAVDLLQEVWGWLDSPVPHRLYRTITGVLDTVIEEMEFEDYEAREKFWADFVGRPEFPAALERWLKLRAPSASVEFLTLVE